MKLKFTKSENVAKLEIFHEITILQQAMWIKALRIIWALLHCEVGLLFQITDTSWF